MLTVEIRVRLADFNLALLVVLANVLVSCEASLRLPPRWEPVAVLQLVKL